MTHINIAADPGPLALLREILRREPRAGLHEIRSRHPGLAAMSLDHLGLTVSRMIDSAADRRAK